MTRNTKPTNRLTAEIIRFLQLQGHQAERISVTGRQIKIKQRYQGGLFLPGMTGTYEKTKWIKSSMTEGSADISATIKGRSVKIEIKTGRDTQKEAQKRYQSDIERAGGVYIIVGHIDQFLAWYNQFMAA